MICPHCDYLIATDVDGQVILDSRSTKKGEIRRRRRCPKCEGRFTTYERIDMSSVWEFPPEDLVHICHA